MGVNRLLLILQAIYIAQVSSRAINISTAWALPQEAFPHFFRYIQEAATWDAAKSVCESYQAELLTVETGERRDAARAYLRELDVLDRVWIGLKRQTADTAFTWTGGGSGGPVTGDGFWQEPPPLEPAEQCVAVNPLFDFRWQPLSCTEPETNPFICQLPVPFWAKDCLVSSLPSLTITFLHEKQVIELLSDCGLSGTKRIACKGGEKSAELIKRLSCEHDDETRNFSTTWSSSSREQSWGTSTTLGSITSQITHSSGTRHKRESHGTSTATDSSLISTSDSTWEREEKNTTETPDKELERIGSKKATTLLPEKHEDQIEENRGQPVDQLSSEQKNITQVEVDESDAAVEPTKREPPIIKSNNPQLERSTEGKRLELLNEPRGNQNPSYVSQVIQPTPIPITLYGVPAFETYADPSKPLNVIERIREGDKEDHNITGLSEISEKEPNYASVKAPAILQIVAIEDLDDIELPSQSRVPSANITDNSSSTQGLVTVGSASPTTKGLQETGIPKTFILLPGANEKRLPATEPQASNASDILPKHLIKVPLVLAKDIDPEIRIPTTAAPIAEETTDPGIGDLFDREDVVILDEIDSKIKMAHVESAYISSPVTKPQIIQDEVTIETEATGFNDTKSNEDVGILNPEEAEILKTNSEKDKQTFQKYQLGSAKNTMNDGRNGPKNSLNFVGWPGNQFKQVENANTELVMERKKPESKQITEFQTDIPVIVIAEMDEIGGKESEDVEQVQPYTPIENELIVSSTSENSDVKEVTTAAILVKLETQTTVTEVNSKSTEAVPVTGRLFFDKSTDDPIEMKSNQSVISPSTDVSRSTIANEPKDTVSDSTTRVQTMSTPTQGEVLTDENNEEIDTPKRTNRDSQPVIDEAPNFSMFSGSATGIRV